ncbi:hypothetical protein ACFL4N_01480 [Thermodesulfobacteriota bacterium]
MECKALKFKGASGKAYAFHACALELALNDVGAVYALTKRTIKSNGEDFFTVVYLGQTGKLGKAISKHREQLWALEHECNSVCIHLEEDVMKRIGKIDDLEKYYSPRVEPYAVKREGTGSHRTV